MADLRVLVVDDEPEVAAGHAAYVRRVPGFELVGTAGTVQTAVSVLTRQAVDLVLLDLNLPDMTGIDILTKLKANEHTRRAPVIVLTTTDDQREIQRCYDLGANVYITKPLNYESFADAIRQLGLFLSVMQAPDIQ